MLKRIVVVCCAVLLSARPSSGQESLVPDKLTLAEARLERFRIEDQYVGSLVGVEYAEAFKSRSPLLVVDPTLFLKTPFG